MVEVIPIGVALATGFSVLITRLHNRVSTLDQRLDGIELRMAEKYITKQEFTAGLERLEQHMIRIEDKLETLAFPRRS